MTVSGVEIAPETFSYWWVNRWCRYILLLCSDDLVAVGLS